MLPICSNCLESPENGSLTSATLTRGDRREQGHFCEPCLTVISTWPDFTLAPAPTELAQVRRMSGYTLAICQYVMECNRLLKAANAESRGDMGMGFLSQQERDEQESACFAGEAAGQFVARLLAARRIEKPAATTTIAAAQAQAQAQRQVVGIRQAVNAIREASRCRACGKPRLVLNTAGYRQRYRPETVSIESHCGCKGGPAHPDAPLTPHIASRGKHA